MPHRTLSEPESKALLAGYGVPFAPERRVPDPGSAVEAARSLGLPVAVKLAGDRIAHKSERGLVRLGLGDDRAVETSAVELLAAATPEDGRVELLVAPMVSGHRELIAGLHRDPQFGMTVLLGVGGVLAEAVADVAVRLVPLNERDALDAIDDLRAQTLLGPFRGEPPVDRRAVADVLLALAAAAEDRPDLRSADLNPLIVVDGRPVAVDALVEVADG